MDKEASIKDEFPQPSDRTIRVRKFYEIAGKTLILIDAELIKIMGIDDTTFVEQYALDSDIIALKIRRAPSASSD